jgi:hypothetical protein
MTGGPPGWWQASDGNWYPPEQHPDRQQVPEQQGSVQPVAEQPQPGAAPPARGRFSPKIVAIAAACVVALVVGLVLALRDGGDGGGGKPLPSAGGSGALPSGPDVLPDKSITLADAVTVIRGKGGRTVKSLGSDGRSLVLDGSVDGVKDLRPGSVALITGMTALRVVSAEPSGNDVRIVGAPASLPDVVANGTLDWSKQAVDPQRGELILSPDASTDGSDNPAEADVPSPSDTPLPSDTPEPDDPPIPSDTPAPSDTPLPSEGPFQSAPPGDSVTGGVTGTPGASTDGLTTDEPQSLRGLANVPREATTGTAGGRTVSGKVSGVDFKLSYRPDGGGHELQLYLSKKEDFTGELGAVIKLSALRGSGHAEVQDGSVRSFSSAFDDLSGSAEIGGYLVALKNTAAISTPPFIKVPASVSFPFPIGGIPFVVKLDVSIKVNMSISLKGDAVGAKVRVEYSGDAGFSFHDGAVKLQGNRKQDILQDPLSTLKGGASGPVGFVVTYELPKIGIGFYFLQTGAGVYLSDGLVTSAFVAGGSPIPCYQVQQAFVLAGGVEAKFLGKDVEVARSAIVDKRWNFYRPKDPRCGGN